MDLTWVGGISEAKKISDMADTYFIPTSPHTCGGPLLWFASIHICTALPNFLIMESNLLFPWIQRARKINSQEYYKYIFIYTDGILVVSVNLKQILDILNSYFL